MVLFAPLGNIFQNFNAPIQDNDIGVVCGIWTFDPTRYTAEELEDPQYIRGLLK